MSADVSKSVVLIHSGQENAQHFGTGFLIYQDACVAYAVTCAHVVRGIGRDVLFADGRPATVVAEDSEDGFDVAVLKIEPMPGYAALRVDSGQTGGAFDTVGFSGYGKQKPAQTLSGTLAKQVEIPSLVLGCRVKGWRVEIRDNALEPGNSGSPVVDAASGCVIGFLTTRKEAGAHGLAVSIDAVRYLQWENRPADLFDRAGASPPAIALMRRSDEHLMNFKHEIPAFRAIVRHEDQQSRLLLIHGPSSAGKTRLLDEYARIAADNNINLLRFGLGQQISIEKCLRDIVSSLGKSHFPTYHTFYKSGCPQMLSRDAERKWYADLTEEFFTDLAGAFSRTLALVVLFDQYEKADSNFKGWLTEAFLPQLASQALLVVIAGQEQVQPPPGWQPPHNNFHLTGVPFEDYQSYATAHGVAIDKDRLTDFHTLLNGLPGNFVKYVQTLAMAAGGVR